jgi:hypothetical protein
MSVTKQGFSTGSDTNICTPPPPLTCRNCGLSRDDLGKRLPHGWKRQSDFVYCPACWQSLYLLRAIILPVASPLDCGWQELRVMLHGMWAATTRASNWLVTELYSRDIKRGDQPRMPPMPNVYLYPEARERFPTLPSRAIASLEQKVKRSYRAKRYETIWTCSASLPTYRYPSPFSIPSQGWTIHEEDSAPVIKLRIGSQDLRLRLKSGPRYSYQMESIAQILSGEAVRSELSIYQRANEIVCKLMAWLPRQVVGEQRSGVLTVRTASDALLVAVNARDEKIWAYNGDQLRRWQAEHRTQLQRWAEDSKAEFRPSPPFAERRSNASRKYRDRMSTACHSVAALVVNYAIRRKFAAVRYDDSYRGYCQQFPWFELKLKITQKCDAAGLRFEHAANGIESAYSDVTDSSEVSDICATG